MIEILAFYLLSALLLFFAYKVVTTPFVLRAAVYLINALLVVAGLYLLLSAEFTAAIQILVYVGGIVVITIFAIILVSSVGSPSLEVDKRTQAWSLISVSLLVFLMIASFLATPLPEAPNGLIVNTQHQNAKQIGEALLSLEQDGFILPFEIVSLLLLAALIGAIVVARTKPEQAKPEQAKPEQAEPKQVNDSQQLAAGDG